MYVIQRNDGAYIAPLGSKSSYTRTLGNARKFSTKEAAEAERCPGNEHVVSVWDLLR
jgi:hypothetical protein